MDMNNCRRCGKALTITENHVYQCANGHTIFANCSPSVGIFILTPNDTVLLSRRGVEPHKGMLDAFGGFVDGEELLEKAVARELTEELQLLSSEYEPPVYLTSGIGHYPFKGEILPVLSAFFWTRLTTSRKLTPLDDVAEIVEVGLDDIDYSLLHDDDIKRGVMELQKQFTKAAGD